jgi:hypothetical protein
MDKKQNWYFTFGCGQLNEGKYCIIQGTYEEARAEMVKRFGWKWASQYSEEQWVEDDRTLAEKWGWTLLK